MAQRAVALGHSRQSFRLKRRAVICHTELAAASCLFEPPRRCRD